MSVRIYHNPNCSKSCQVLDRIIEKGIEPEVVTYLDQPLSAEEIRELLAEMEVSPRHILRDDVPAYQELKLADDSLSDQTLIEALAAHPALLNRPIVATSKGVKLCRPIELVDSLL